MKNKKTKMSDTDRRDEIEKLREKIEVLIEIAWQERGMKSKDLERWISNFSKDDCSVSLLNQEWAAMHLLSKFLYFSDDLIRKLLKSLYQDIFRTPLVHKIRRENNDTLNSRIIMDRFHRELAKTRFIGVGNPSESGCHLLYYFRQENQLKSKLFIHGHEALLHVSPNKSCSNSHNVSRYVFIDDFCGSGTQATYTKELVSKIRNFNAETEIWYCTLVGTIKGLKKVGDEVGFDKTESVLILDDTFKCFSNGSRYFNDQQDELKNDAKVLCEYYGELLARSDKKDRKPLGFGDCQLLLGFHHNTPNNTIPIFWATDTDFYPIFHRYPKLF